MKEILFVCTGNVFRSASADYLFKHFLQKHHNSSFNVNSAGTKGHPFPPYSKTIERVSYYGADMTHHKSIIITQKIVDKADIIICMAQKHRDFIIQNFHRESYLFNELAYDLQMDLKDDVEASGEYADLDTFIEEVIDVIALGIPELCRKLQLMD